MITASQYAPSRLKPVILERKRTDAEFLNCSVSSALDSAGLGLSFAAAPCSVRAPSSEEACAFTPGRKLKHIASVRRTNHKPNRGFFIVHLPGPGIRRVRAPCESFPWPGAQLQRRGSAWLESCLPRSPHALLRSA